MCLLLLLIEYYMLIADRFMHFIKQSEVCLALVCVSILTILCTHCCFTMFNLMV